MALSPDIEILLLHMYSVLASEINSGAESANHSSRKTSRHISKPNSVALLEVIC